MQLYCDLLICKCTRSDAAQ